MPSYRYRCGTHGDFEQWKSIHDDSGSGRCRLCGGRCKKVFTAPRIGGVAARSEDVRETALSKDLDAYRTLRRQGLQPNGIDGCDALARVAETRTEIEMGRRLPKGAAWVGSEVASEMLGKDVGELRRTSREP